MQLGDYEQDARIALMEHFRFYLQYWGTVLLALAAAFLSIVQLRSSLGSLGLTVLLMDLILWQAGYAVLMMVLHGKFCEEAVAKKTDVQPSTDGTPYVVLLHNAIVKNPNDEKHGLDTRLRWIGTWTGWAVVTLASLGVGFLASALFDPIWCLFWPLIFVFVVAALIVSKHQHVSRYIARKF